jgi:hypothetical protein
VSGNASLARISPAIGATGLRLKLS